MKVTPEFATIHLLRERLVALGYTYKNLVLGGENFTQFRSPSGAVWLTCNTNITYPFISRTARDISRYKNLAYDLAEDLGLSVPFTVKIKTGQELTERQRARLLAKYGTLIVKPNNASLSRGFTPNITTKGQLKEAIIGAQTYSDSVLIQNQVEGQEIRFAVTDGRVVAAMLRQTPRLVGDGRSTLGQLLEAENKARRTLVFPYLTYPQLTQDIVPIASLDLNSVPKNGEVIELSKSTMIKNGASVFNVLPDVHASYITIAETMARQLGGGFVAVDILIKNYAKPANAKNYAFLEFNMAPVIKLFYGCRDGRMFDILTYLVPKIDDQLTRQAVFGSFEIVSFPELGIKDVVAKVDTGAYSGALYATDIHVERLGGKPMLHFHLLGDKTKLERIARRRWAPVTSSTGHGVKRYIFDTIIEIKGIKYPITIGVGDRSKLKYPVLLGRRFLRENNIVVDVRINQDLDNRRSM